MELRIRICGASFVQNAWAPLNLVTGNSMSNHPAVTPTFTKSDESWSVESTLLVFDSLQILNNSDNVFKNYDVTKFDIFRLGHQ